MFRPMSSSGSWPRPRCRWAGSASPTRSPGWSRSWPVTGRATSPARRSTWPVAWESSCEAGVMCRLLGYCSRGEAALADLIGDEGLCDLTALSALHSDGWGMAWYTCGEPVIRKSPLRADDEPEYDKLARQPLSDLGLLHLRWATPGMGISEGDSHPFRYGPYVLAHNGAIHPQDRLDELLPPDWRHPPANTTDSERYFLLIMSRLAAGGDMIAAIAAAAASIERRFSPNSLN